MMNNSKRGFTLLEVLVVVVIAVSVTLFAVPAYKKTQEKNKYLIASGVLTELGAAVNMFREDFPDLVLGEMITKAKLSVSNTDDLNLYNYVQQGDQYVKQSVPGVLIQWLVQKKYFAPFPMGDDNKYMGYRFGISTDAQACSGLQCKRAGTTYNPQAVACMTNSDMSNEKYKCAWVDKSGNFHHT